MWDLIGLVPDHCISLYYGLQAYWSLCKRTIFIKNLVRAIKAIGAVRISDSTRLRVVQTDLM